VDVSRFEEGIELCEEVLHRFGVEGGRTFRGTLNAGHPGGTVPLSASDVATMHPPRLPENVYVADASLLPRSIGNPPILTIAALAKRVARVCVERIAARPPEAESAADAPRRQGPSALGSPVECGRLVSADTRRG
jgi:hypothetical protein